MKDWLDFLRGSVRPGLTWLMGLLFCLIVIYRWEVNTKAWDIIQLVFFFWFIQRQVEKKP